MASWPSQPLGTASSASGMSPPVPSPRASWVTLRMSSRSPSPPTTARSSQGGATAPSRSGIRSASASARLRVPTSTPSGSAASVSTPASTNRSSCPAPGIEQGVELRQPHAHVHAGGPRRRRQRRGSHPRRHNVRERRQGHPRLAMGARHRGEGPRVQRRLHHPRDLLQPPPVLAVRRVGERHPHLVPRREDSSPSSQAGDGRRQEKCPRLLLHMFALLQV
ncbi:hypothetical protein MUK42_28112 [Musa troglodytarum]|uniref:Uncharacterized protein n=1 Tax=Musa troglodytarum TaxID=320322 RepID=A0A9E7F4M0_9LILI|nr:hypothetical protein MUK42_28112 [Musa troglodytarum]